MSFTKRAPLPPYPNDNFNLPREIRVTRDQPHPGSFPKQEGRAWERGCIATKLERIMIYILVNPIVIIFLINKLWFKYENSDKTNNMYRARINNAALLNAEIINNNNK